MTQAEQFHIQSGLLLTSISHHSFCSFQQSQRRTVYLPEFRVVCLNCWEGTRPKIVCHQPRWCWLFLPRKSSKHLGKILPSKVQRADPRTVHRFPIGPSVKHKVDPFFCLLTHSGCSSPKKQNFMQANSIVGVRCFTAAIYYTSIRHNKASFLVIFTAVTTTN